MTPFPGRPAASARADGRRGVRVGVAATCLLVTVACTGGMPEAPRAFTGGFTTVEAKNVPWFVTVAVRHSGQWNVCSGALTTPRTVATAAHCVLEGAEYWVYRGALLADDHVKASSAQVLAPKAGGDVAMLTLPTALPNSHFLEVSDAPPVVGGQYYLFGVGTVPGQATEAPKNRTIHRLLVGAGQIDTTNRIAAVVAAKRHMGCVGDSGGPMVNKELTTLYGVISTGYPKGAGVSCPAIPPTDALTKIGIVQPHFAVLSGTPTSAATG